MPGQQGAQQGAAQTFMPASSHHNADRAAGAKGAVYGQVSHIQDACR